MHQGEKSLAVLLDPENVDTRRLEEIIEKIEASPITYIFVGGSTAGRKETAELIESIKRLTNIPVLIFPGDVSQLSSAADAVLFLSLVSGRNPDFLIGKHVESVSVLRSMDLEVIPTGYLLIANGKETAVESVTRTVPMPTQDVQAIVDTAKAAELLGMQCVYLEAGSGALRPISEEIIRAVRRELTVPLLVGGGIRTPQQVENAYKAGADMVIIGTAFEKDETFFENLELLNKASQL